MTFENAKPLLTELKQNGWLPDRNDDNVMTKDSFRITCTNLKIEIEHMAYPYGNHPSGRAKLSFQASIDLQKQLALVDAFINNVT